MAVEPAEPDQCRTRFSGHLEAVPDGGAGVAHQHPVGPWPDVFAEQIGIAREPAIGNHNGIGTDIQHFTMLVCDDAGDPAPLQAQRCRSGAEQEPALALLSPPAQFAEQPVRAAPLPILPATSIAREGASGSGQR